MAATTSFMAAASFVRATFSSFSWRKTSIARCWISRESFISASEAPSALAMSSAWALMISIPGKPVPAIMTMKATSFDRDAAIGAIRPPSLWPASPIFAESISFRVFRNATPASASPAKSSVVDSVDEPVEPPTPRSSTRSTAIPRGSECVGDDEEWLVSQDGLIAILRRQSR